MWQIAKSLERRQLEPQLPDGFIIDHSGYVLGVGSCAVCVTETVLAFVTMTNRLVFRCSEGHENTTNADGFEYPVWSLSESSDSTADLERYASAGDIAEVIALSGPSPPRVLALSDMRWAILPRP